MHLCSSSGARAAAHKQSPHSNMLSQRTALLQRVHLVPRQQQQQHICCASVQQQQTAQQQPNSATPVLSDDEEDDQQALNPQQQAALAALQAVFTPLEVDKLLSSSKRSVLDLPTGDWIEFMQGYNLGKAAIWRTLRYSTHQLSDPYTAGAAIRWLKQLGPWSDADVADRLLPCYPKVLATSTEALQALYDHLTASLGFSEADVQQLLWECPGLMADYREEMLPLVTRMVQSRRDKYTIGGTYVD